MISIRKTTQYTYEWYKDGVITLDARAHTQFNWLIMHKSSLGEIKKPASLSVEEMNNKESTQVS